MSACKNIVCLWMGACKYPLQTWQDSDVTIFEISVNIKGTSECTCDTVLPERHQENWVWLCRRVKPHTDFFFQISQMWKMLQQQCVGIPLLGSCFHIYESSCHSRMLQTFMGIKINRALLCHFALQQINSAYRIFLLDSM